MLPVRARARGGNKSAGSNSSTPFSVEEGAGHREPGTRRFKQTGARPLLDTHEKQ